MANQLSTKIDSCNNLYCLSGVNFGCDNAEMIRHDRLQKLMKAKGITQRALAEEIGISPQAVSKIVQGGTADPRKLPYIARMLSVSIDYLTGESDDPSIDASDLALDRQDRLVLDLFNHLEPADKKAVLQIMQSITKNLKIPMLQSKRAEYMA
jgi:transcriptional regulator with XRE-family HTH domain